MAARWAIPLLSVMGQFAHRGYGHADAVPNQWLYMTGHNLGEVDVRADDKLESLVYDSDDEEKGRAIVSVKKVDRADPSGIAFDGVIEAASDKDCKEWAEHHGGKTKAFCFHICNGFSSECPVKSLPNLKSFILTNSAC